MLKQSLGFLKDIYSSRSLLLNLSKNDFKSRYIGNNLGILWAFIQPLITILIMWFVFSVGFKVVPIGDFPFILWLISAMIPWFFFADAVTKATSSVMVNSFLVKKIVFRVSLLPIVQIISASLIHLFFIAFMIFVFLIYGVEPSWYWLQIIYYFIFTVLLILGISWFTSAVVVFFKDMGQVVAVCVQFGFWVTPIFWNIDMLHKYAFICRLNPVFYITQGYRDSLLYHEAFWDKPLLMIYNWIFVLVFLVLGSLVFRKLRPHFADVL
jgi:lipopolysaccharide transport system permease protein